MPDTNASPAPRWYHRIGPGLITACVVIGPGSILTSSKVGATNGFGISWVVFVAAGFMLVYMALGAKLGVLADKSPGTLIAERAGRPVAILIGGAVFFISSSFQFGNNMGVDSAFKVFDAFKDWPYLIVAFNALAIAFLFVFKNLYRALERLMTGFVAVMLICFAANLAFALMPAKPATSSTTNAASQAEANDEEKPQKGLLDLSVLALIGTTFVSTAAFYQAYLARQKGWTKSDLKSGMIDVRVGAAIMGLITLMIMWTSASVLRGEQLNDVQQVALQLAPLFGESGKILFCLGLFSAAYSSFLVNSMIGGFMLADGLGLGSKPTDLVPRLLTTAVLLTGMVVALLVINKGWNPVPAIVAAQAVTVIAAPLLAAALLWLTNLRSVVGDDRNGPAMNFVAGLGLLMLLVMAYNTAVIHIPAKLRQLQESAALTTPEKSQK